MKYAVAISIVFAIARFIVPVEGVQSGDVFKDLAHCWVGGLFGAWVASRSRGYLAVGVALTVLEVVAAVVRKS